MSGSDATTFNKIAPATALIPPHLRGSKLRRPVPPPPRIIGGGPVRPAPAPAPKTPTRTPLVPVPPKKPIKAPPIMLYSDSESDVDSGTGTLSSCIVSEDILQYFVPVKKLGEGSFGKVYSARLTHEGYGLLSSKIPKREIPSVVAIKEIDIVQTHSISTEIYFLSKLRLPGCIKYYGCIEIPDKKVYIIMEYYQGIDLFELIVDDVLPMDSKLKIARNIAHAIDELHRCGVVHRDIKPENVMVNPDTLAIKLIDYGLSCDIETAKGACTTLVGTPGYYDPHLSISTLDSADWWSFGQLLVAMYLGTLLYDNKKYRKLTPTELSQFPPALHSMINELTNPDLEPDARPKMAEILSTLTLSP